MNLMTDIPRGFYEVTSVPADKTALFEPGDYVEVYEQDLYSFSFMKPESEKYTYTPITRHKRIGDISALEGVELKLLRVLGVISDLDIS